MSFTGSDGNSVLYNFCENVQYTCDQKLSQIVSVLPQDKCKRLAGPIGVSNQWSLLSTI